MRIPLATAFAVLSIAMLVGARASAEAPKTTIVSVEGPIVEITSESITIKDTEREKDWFRLGVSPRILAADGKTRYPRDALHPGMRVRVFYDWQATTYVRAADHIIALTRGARPAKE
jgi:hypothetical protein